MAKITQFDIFITDLEPTRGSQIGKRRPCVVISPNEMNQLLRTVIVLPMTSTSKKHYPWRVPFERRGAIRNIALDQIKTVDRTCLHKRVGSLSPSVQQKVLDGLAEMFAIVSL